MSFSFGAEDPKTSLDLITIFNLAEKNDPGLSSVRFENQAAQELLPQGKALFLPTIVVNANINQNNVNRASETTFDPSLSYLGSNKTRYQSYGYGVLLKQPIINYENKCIFEPIETNANKNNIVFNASLSLHRANSKNYLMAFTAFFDKAANPSSMNASMVTTTLNVFNLKSSVNTQIAIAIPNWRTRMSSMPILKMNYNIIF